MIDFCCIVQSFFRYGEIMDLKNLFYSYSSVLFAVCFVTVTVVMLALGDVPPGG